jgi:hypothetical protein
MARVDPEAKLFDFLIRYDQNAVEMERLWYRFLSR